MKKIQKTQDLGVQFIKKYGESSHANASSLLS